MINKNMLFLFFFLYSSISFSFDSYDTNLIDDYCKHEYLNKYHASLTSKLNKLTLDEAITQMENDLMRVFAVENSKHLPKELVDELKSAIVEVYYVNTSTLKEREQFINKKYDQCLIENGVAF